MGVIYEARHVDVQRKVALKVIREDRFAGDASEKIRHEAKTASSIGSEFIVEVYDLGELPDGRMYIALELIDGHDLFDEISAAPMALPRLVAILRQVAKGLAAAHAAGVVHRDVKPENIRLTRRRGRPDAIKIVDFGISRVGGLQAAHERRGVGTPAYMAPERWAGESFEGASVDMYAVGCLAYELLTGRPPFVGSVQDVMMAHFEDTPPPLARVKPGLTVPAEIEGVILRCLAKKPADRFTSMAEFEAALCEAQVAAGIETAWDDLPLPEMEDNRRDALLRTMPNSEVVRIVRPSVRWIAGLLVLVFGLAALGVWLTNRWESAAIEARSEIDALTDRAKEAAARASWVYPPTGTAEETAFRWVLALEQRGDGAASRRAAELRQEFSETLARIGDRYWDRDGGRVFAVDYYAQALVFTPDDTRLRERARLTPGEFATLRAKASDLAFSEAERQALESLVLLASDDEATVMAQVESYLDAGKERSLSEASRLQAFVGAPSVAPTQTSLEQTAFAPDDVHDAPTESAQDRVASLKLSAQAERRLARGRREDAEALFHRALSADRFNSRALIGLGNLYFDRADYYKAMEYASRAVRVKPKQASYHIVLGDAFYRLLRYNDARRHYETAHRLGNHQATARLQKIERKVGRP